MSGKATDGFVEIGVRDRGIPQADRPHVVERFYRGAESGVSDGLGLTLVAAVAQLHEGSESFEIANVAAVLRAWTR